MKIEITKERNAKLKALEAEAAKAEAEHFSFEETIKDIDKSIGNTIANIDAILEMLK